MHGIPHHCMRGGDACQRAPLTRLHTFHVGFVCCACWQPALGSGAGGTAGRVQI